MQPIPVLSGPMVELDFDNELTLLLEDDMPPEGLRVVFVVPNWQARDYAYGALEALAFRVVENEGAALAWFDDVRLTRPWETRQ